MGNAALRNLAGSDKADGPAAVYTGGLYGPFSRYLAERPFPQSLALQTFLSFFLSFFLSLVLGQTNKNQSERLNCPEAPGARSGCFEAPGPPIIAGVGAFGGL